MIPALLLCLMPIATDGDTIRCGSSEVRIRIFGVNAPEKGAPGYAQSTQALQADIGGGLICEPRGTSYSRIVALCRNAAGADISALQLHSGHALEWCSYSKGYYGTC